MPVNTSAIQIEFNQPPPELTRNSSKCTFEFRAEILSLSRKSLYYCRLSLFSPCSTVYISISCPYTLFALVLASGIAAQIPEPDFIGEVLAIHSDGTAEKLEKHNVKMRTGAGVYIAGLAVNKSKTKILVAGSQANVRFAADEPVNLIVRAVDNKTDPMSIVRVFAMKNNRKQRSAVISAVGSFNVTSNDMEYLPFTAEKYGENSYYLTFGDAPAGEYGIIVTNPNNVDEKMIIVSAFGIDPEKMPAASGSETAEDTE